MRRLLGPGLFFLALAACETQTPASTPRSPLVKNTAPYLQAARRLTQRYSASPMAGWEVRASAAGTDCKVLFVETKIILETSMVDAIHYGVAAYDFLPGGVKQFGRLNAFRGVAYQDVTGYRWRYGNVSAAEAQALKPCR
ncbi:MAG TPA: hypothetical protein VE974_21435 [Thermoanaerobaculia bacterium]|nr:hypothetical protein [Thermoanaerobaculia bacterium]